MDAPVAHLSSDALENEPAPPTFTHQQIVQVLTGIMLCILLAAIDQTVVVPAVPAIAADLHGFDHLSWIVSAYLLTSTSAMPVYGKLSDIYGRRVLLLPAIVLFCIASALCALSQSLFQLIIFRALQGIGGAGLMAMAQAAIADVVAPRERGKYQGYMASAWGIASILGPILGGWVTDQFSWHWIFWLNVPICVAAFVLSNRALRLLTVHRRTGTRIDYAGAALLTGFITLCLLIMSWGGVSYDWDSATIIGLGVFAVLLLGALIVREMRCADPLLPPRLFANPVICIGIAIALLLSAGLFGGTFLLPLFFQLVGGADASASGSLLVPFLGTNVIGAYVSGQLARRLGKTKIIVIGGIAATVLGFGLLATIGADTPGLLTTLYMVIVGFGIGVCMPASLVIVQNAAARRDVGAATGALLFLRSMGGALGSTLVGALLTNRFADRLAQLGVTTPIDLASLRGGGGGVLAKLDPATQATARLALTSGFHLAFLACFGLSVLALLVVFGMRDLPLRSGEKT
ncbi:MAG TPA: MDR family MFS transporter [Acetobacteraceae bacterium]|jgi:EmrB/QacA subfamily drug resistance transporter